MTAKSMGVFFKMRIIKPYYGYIMRILLQEITVDLIIITCYFDLINIKFNKIYQTHKTSFMITPNLPANILKETGKT